MLESVFNKVAGLWACNFITKKLQHRCFPVKFAKFLRKPMLKNICERLPPYFHYNSHHHYQHHHFHYHCKMHLYYLRILLPIHLDCNITPCLFQLNFVFFLSAIRKGGGGGRIRGTCFRSPLQKKRFLRFPISIEEILRLRRRKYKNVVIIYTCEFCSNCYVI